VTRKEHVKVDIPWELHIAIVKLQAKEETTYEEACKLASKLLEPNSEAYRKEVEKEINKQDRSQIMSTVNKSKASWIKKGYDQGFEAGNNIGYKRGEEGFKITYPCAVCGGELIMMPGAADHEAVKKYLKEKGWAHSTCLKQT
jgi:flagellar biosynthesis/type III secretory pathway protein FliH